MFKCKVKRYLVFHFTYMFKIFYCKSKLTLLLILLLVEDIQRNEMPFPSDPGVDNKINNN